MFILIFIGVLFLFKENFIFVGSPRRNNEYISLKGNQEYISLKGNQEYISPRGKYEYIFLRGETRRTNLP